MQLSALLFFDKMYADRMNLMERIKKLKAKQTEDTEMLRLSLESPDKTTVEILAALLEISKGYSKSAIEECIQKVEQLSGSGSEAMCLVERVCSNVGSLITIIEGLEQRQFSLLHAELRQRIIYAGARDYVADFCNSLRGIQERPPIKRLESAVHDLGLVSLLSTRGLQ